MRVKINQSGLAALTKYVEKKIENQIVDGVEQDAKRYVPVLTGALRRSIRRNRLRKLVWHVKAGGKTASYAVPVELGHRIVHRDWQGNIQDTGRVAPPQPYLRPALYKRRPLR